MEIKTFFDIFKIIQNKLPKPDAETINKHTNIWMINNIMSSDKTYCIIAHELSKYNMSKNEYFDFLYNFIPKNPKYIKYLAKKESVEKDIQYIQEFYGYNREKATSALDLISNDELTEIKRYFEKRGLQK